MSQVDSAEVLKLFIGRLKLKEIRCVHLSFALDEALQQAPNRFEFKLDEKIDYGFNPEMFHFKVAANARVLSDDTPVGTLETKFVIIHDLEQGDEISTDTINDYLGSTGLMVVFPYVREIIQSTMARFGLGGVVLDLFKKPE